MKLSSARILVGLSTRDRFGKSPTSSQRISHPEQRSIHVAAVCNHEITHTFLNPVSDLRHASKATVLPATEHATQAFNRINNDLALVSSGQPTHFSPKIETIQTSAQKTDERTQQLSQSTRNIYEQFNEKNKPGTILTFALRDQILNQAQSITPIIQETQKNQDHILQTSTTLIQQMNPLLSKDLRVPVPEMQKPDVERVQSPQKKG